MAWVVKTKPNCSFCVSAKNYLKAQGIEYTEQVFDTEEKIEAFRNEGFRSFPQIFDGDVHVGGYAELTDYLF